GPTLPHSLVLSGFIGVRLWLFYVFSVSLWFISCCSASAGWQTTVPCIPHEHGSTEAPRDDESTVGAEAHAGEGGCVPRKGNGFLSRLGVPQLDHPIRASRDNALAVGAEAHAGHRAGMSLEGGDQVTAFRIPDMCLAALAEARRLVPTSRDDPF